MRIPPRMQPPEPRVSVLMPVRDGALHLDEAMSSLVAQTLSEIEIVVVDDGSTDGTPELLESWARRDPRVRPLRQEAAGIVAALERAREAARAPYLARMDADDVADPRRLEAQLKLMEERPECVAVGCGVEYFPDELVRDGARRYQGWINSLVTPEDIERSLFVECPLAHPTFFLRTEAVAAVGGYRDAGWAEDYDLVLRLWEAGGRFGKVPEPLLRWREASGRLSRTHQRYSPEAFRRCKVSFLSRTLLADRDGVVLWGAGPVGKAFSRELARAGVRVRAFVEVDPRKLGQEIHGAPVLDPDSGLEIRDAMHLGAVGRPGARERLRDMVREAGLREPGDFVAIA